MTRCIRICAALLLLSALCHAPSAEEKHEPLLAAGPMPAWAEMTSAAIWVQTTRLCAVQLRYWPEQQSKQARLSAEKNTWAGSDHIATFVLKDLEPGTRYTYELYLDGTLQQFEWPLRFQTQPVWRWRGPAPDFTFTLGSCLYVNEERFDRPGTPYGGDFELLDALAAEPADFMLWLGDNTYLREPDWLTEEGIRHRYAHTRAFPKLQKVLATRHNYAIWDDHDYGPNDSDRSYRLKETSLEVFKDYWPGVQYGTDTAPGCFSRFEWADVEFFLLDDRYYRTPGKALDDAATMFGERQLQWLKDGLSNSVATFKVIVAGGQMMNPLAPFEALARFPRERQEIINYIVDNRVSGVLFLSGDRHMSELIRVTPQGGYPLYDFTCSPLSSGTRTPKADDAEFENPARVPGTLVGGKRNYGRVKLSGTGEERALQLSCHGKDGGELWSRRIAVTELRFPD